MTSRCKPRAPHFRGQRRPRVPDLGEPELSARSRLGRLLQAWGSQIPLTIRREHIPSRTPTSEPAHVSAVFLCDRSVPECSRGPSRARSRAVADQTESDRELIVVDGGSTDGTLEIIRARSDVIAHSVSERDSGVYAAMNKGTRLASGRWLLFLGANDSLIHPDVLLKVRTAIGDDRDAIYCGEAEYHDGRVWPAPVRPRVAYGNFMHHQSTFYHRSLFERGVTTRRCASSPTTSSICGSGGRAPGSFPWPCASRPAHAAA